jgi:hypothetical protein
MQFMKGNFISLRATTKIHLGQIGEDVLEDDVIEFDGQTLKLGGHEHQLSALKGAIRAGWFVVATDTTSKYAPKPSGVRIKTALTQEEDSDRTEMVVQTIADEERVVGTVQSSTQTANRNVEAQEAISVGTIKTQAKQKVNLADTQAVQEQLSRLEKPLPKADIKKIATPVATGDVQEAIVGEKLTELLPNAATPETPVQESSALNWDKKLHYTKRVKLALELATTNPTKFAKVMDIETDSVKKRINDALA